jgi:hypothetical protein
MIDLQAIFGDGPTVATVATPNVAVSPEPVLRPDAADTPDDSLAASPFVDWLPRPDGHGRMGWQSPDAPEVVLFDDLPMPGAACAVCGSVEGWTDLLGRQRCGVCEGGVLAKALQLAEKVAQLRSRTDAAKSAPRIAPCCVAGGRVDMLDLEGKRPVEREPGALTGRESG